MGNLFVLPLYVVAGLLLARVGAGILAIISDRVLRSASPEQRLRARRVGLRYALLCVPYAGVSWLVYGAWCEHVRGVDAGIGDWWKGPLGSGYSIVMVDDSDVAAIETPGGEHVGHGLTRLGFDEGAVYFEEPDGVLWLIDKGSASLEQLGSEGEFGRETSSPVELRSPRDVYDAVRWTVADLVAALIILAAPVTIGVVLFRRLWSIRVAAGSTA